MDHISRYKMNLNSEQSMTIFSQQMLNLHYNRQHRQHDISSIIFNKLTKLTSYLELDQKTWATSLSAMLDDAVGDSGFMVSDEDRDLVKKNNDEKLLNEQAASAEEYGCGTETYGEIKMEGMNKGLEQINMFAKSSGATQQNQFLKSKKFKKLSFQKLLNEKANG